VKKIILSIIMLSAPISAHAGFLDYGDNSQQGSFYDYGGKDNHRTNKPKKKKDEIPSKPGIHDSMGAQIEAYRQRQVWVEAHRKKQKEQSLAEIKAEQERAKNLNSAYDKVEYLQKQLEKERDRRSHLNSGNN